MNTTGEVISALELIAEVLPEKGETLENLRTRAEKAGYPCNGIGPNGGIVIHQVRQEVSNGCISR